MAGLFKHPETAFEQAAREQQATGDAKGVYRFAQLQDGTWVSLDAITTRNRYLITCVRRFKLLGE